MADRISEAELAWVESIAGDIGAVDDSVIGRLGGVMGRLVVEVRRLRSILDGIYDVVQETQGHEEQLAALELEVTSIREERRTKRRAGD